MSEASPDNVVALASDPENRTDVRARLNLRVAYGTAFDVQTTAYMVNVGHGGVFIRAENPLEVGALIDLEFTLPDSYRTIAAQARVVWSRKTDEGDLFPQGMGLSFTKISAADQRALNDTIRKLAEKHAA